MTTENKDDKAFEEYLQGDSGLSRRYRESERVEPPKRLDDAVLSAAQEAVNTPGNKIFRFVPRNWYRPLSKVALLIICVSLLFTLYETVEEQSLMVTSDAVVPDSEPLGVSGNESHAVDIPHDTVREQNTGETAGGEAAPTPPQAPAAPSRKEEMAPGVAAKRMIQREEVHSEPAEMKEMESRKTPPSTVMEKAGGAPEKDRPASGKESEFMLQDTTPENHRESVSVKTEQEWLTYISELWLAGRKKDAITELQAFIETHPEYPQGEIRKILPDDFEPSLYIRGFEME